MSIQNKILKLCPFVKLSRFCCSALFIPVYRMKWKIKENNAYECDEFQRSEEKNNISSIKYDSISYYRVVRQS